MVPGFQSAEKYKLNTDTEYDDDKKLTKTVKGLKCMQKDNMENQ